MGEMEQGILDKDEENQKLVDEINELKRNREESMKKLEEEKLKALNENNNKENEIKEKNKNIEELNKNLSLKSEENERLNKIVSEIEEKKKQKISLIFELDKTLMGMKGQKKQFIIKEKRNKRLIQIISTLFTKYPLLKLLNVKWFENKSDSKRIDYYENPKGNNLEDNSVISIVLD